MAEYPEDPDYIKRHKDELAYIDKAAGPWTFMNDVSPLMHASEAYTDLVGTIEASDANEAFIVTWWLNPDAELNRDGWDLPIKDSKRQAVRFGPMVLRAVARVRFSILVWNILAVKPSDLTGANGLPHGDFLDRASIPDFGNTNAVLKLGEDLRGKDANSDLRLVANAADVAGSHHQKFWVVRRDKRLTAWAGGVNFEQLDWDDEAHEILNPRRNPETMEGKDRKAQFDKGDYPAFLSRHDWMIRVDGHAAHALLDEFFTRWDDTKQAPPKKVLPDPSDVKQSGTMFVQVSRNGTSDSVPRQIQTAYLAAIKNATKYMYFENQYWTNDALTTAVIDRCAESRAYVIIVMPPAPEETGLLGDLIRGEQAYQLNRMYRAIGPNKLLLYSLFQKHPDRDDYRGLYVHAKLGIIDDCWLTVGSANMTNRSMILDSETNIQLAHRDVVTEMRKRVWTEILGGNEGEAEWDLAIEQGFRKIGIQNEDRKRQGKAMKGFVIPNRLDEVRGDRPPADLRKYL
ncbi:MAG: phospholipase D-like domain-containing protein [Kofleriaceae bacterium]